MHAKCHPSLGGIRDELRGIRDSTRVIGFASSATISLPKVANQLAKSSQARIVASLAPGSNLSDLSALFIILVGDTFRETSHVSGENCDVDMSPNVEG
jgi:hypothetical protein